MNKPFFINIYHSESLIFPKNAVRAEPVEACERLFERKTKRSFPSTKLRTSGEDLAGFFWGMVLTFFFPMPLLAMQEEPKTLTDLDKHCQRTVARYLDQQQCAYVRKIHRNLKEFWNDSEPIIIRPDADTRESSEEIFWQILREKVKAAELMIKRLNTTIDTKKVYIPNAIMLKLGWFRKLSLVPEWLGKTTYVRFLDLSDAEVPAVQLAKLPRLLPLLYELKIIGTTLQYMPKFRLWRSLKRLYLGGNINALLWAKRMPRQLEYLDISHFAERMSGKIPEFLKEMTQLKGLNLSHGHGFHIWELEKLAKFLPQLEDLDLSDNYLDGMVCGVLKFFKKLLRLNLYNNNFGIFNFVALLPSFLPELEELDLGQNNLKSPGCFSEFGRFAKLKILNLAKHPGSEHERAACGHYGCDDCCKNHLSEDEQKKIRNMLPNTKIIFPELRQDHNE